MALFTFKKKSADDVPPMEFQPMPAPSPTDEAIQMRQQGMSNGQIAQALQSKGYQPQQISDALSQAALQGMPQQQFPPQQGFMQQPYAAPQQFSPPPMFQQPPPQEGYSITDERIEEIAEAIIDEKWQELVKDVKKVTEWKGTMEARLDQIEQQVKDTRASMDNMQKAIFGKISDYDKSITNVGTEIKAMEKVFQQVLPSLTESVSRLDRMTKGTARK